MSIEMNKLKILNFTDFYSKQQLELIRNLDLSF